MLSDAQRARWDALSDEWARSADAAEAAGDARLLWWFSGRVAGMIDVLELLEGELDELGHTDAQS